MLFIAAGSFILLVAVAYLIVGPALRSDPSGQDALLENLAARKEHLLADIRDLDADMATGKLDVEDHRRLRAASMVETVQILRALEEAGDAGPASDGGGQGAELGPSGPAIVRDRLPASDGEGDEELEALIDERRRALADRGCPGCGAVYGRADAFCRRCGIRLMGTASAGRVG